MTEVKAAVETKAVATPSKGVVTVEGMKCYKKPVAFVCGSGSICSEFFTEIAFYRAMEKSGHAGMFPKLVRVDTQSDAGVVHLYTEYCGDHLYTVHKKHGFGERSAMTDEIIRGVLSVLVATHAAGFVHGDISLYNIVYDDSYKPPRVRLIDFGGATPILKDGKTSKTLASFPAPESYSSSKSDVWGLGWTLARWLRAYNVNDYINDRTGFRTFYENMGEEIRMQLMGAMGYYCSIIEAMTRPDPAKRIGMKELCALFEVNYVPESDFKMPEPCLAYTDVCTKYLAGARLRADLSGLVGRLCKSGGLSTAAAMLIVDGATSGRNVTTPKEMYLHTKQDKDWKYDAVCQEILKYLMSIDYAIWDFS